MKSYENTTLLKKNWEKRLFKNLTVPPHPKMPNTLVYNLVNNFIYCICSLTSCIFLSVMWYHLNCIPLDWYTEIYLALFVRHLFSYFLQLICLHPYFRWILKSRIKPLIVQFSGNTVSVYTFRNVWKWQFLLNLACSRCYNLKCLIGEAWYLA